MNRAEKTQNIKELAGSIGAARHAFLIEYKGLTVPAVTDLRQKVRGTGGSYVVVKNTLALRAIQDAPMNRLAEHFSGMTAVAHGTDIVAIAKVLQAFSKTNPHMKVKAALVDGQAVSATALETIATMPSRPELVSKLLGLMQSPLRRLVTVLSAPQRNLAATLAAIADKSSKDAAGAPASDAA